MYGSIPTATKRRRASRATTTPIEAHSIQDGNNEPKIVSWGPMAEVPPCLGARPRSGRGLTGAEGERRRGVEELEARVELHEARAAQLAAGDPEIRERLQPPAGGFARAAVG